MNHTTLLLAAPLMMQVSCGTPAAPRSPVEEPQPSNSPATVEETAHPPETGPAAPETGPPEPPLPEPETETCCWCHKTCEDESADEVEMDACFSECDAICDDSPCEDPAFLEYEAARSGCIDCYLGCEELYFDCLDEGVEGDDGCLDLAYGCKEECEKKGCTEDDNPSEILW
jgi:hypothetical protein